jgi:Immunity protein 10
MRVAFKADEGGFEADKYALVCGVAGDGKYLTFQRDAEDSDEDWGVHLEFLDQSNGDYRCIASCRLTPEWLSVDLNQQLGRLAGVTGFDVALHLSKKNWAAVRDGLRRVFRGQSNLITEGE